MGARRPKSSPEKIETYVQRNTPDHLREHIGRPTLGAKFFGAIMSVKERLSGRKAEGLEHIPGGPSLVVSNHSGGETAALFSAFRNHPLRIASGYALNWQRSGFRSWLLKKLGMLSVRETLSNLSDEEKTGLLGRVKGKAQKKAYKEIIQNEREGKLMPNNDFLRSALACLLRGESVAIFPEGLFLYDEKRMLRKAYGGLEILPILPVGIGKRRTSIGEAFTLPEDTGDLSPTDWVMTQLAQELTEKERGVYGSKN